MMSPYVSLLIARERHRELVRAAELSRLRRDAAQARRSISLARDPIAAETREVVVSGGLEPSTSRM
jgi:hypothetical protein